MYSFQSQSKKHREKRLFLVCLTPALLFLVLSLLPQTPAPMLCRLLSVGTATGAAFVASRYLLRRYRYCVAPRGDGSGAFDLTVTEYYGRRTRVVCRIALDSICDVSRQKPPKSYNGDSIQRDFLYADEIASPCFCYLTVSDEDGLCRILILADEGLYDILKRFI